MTERPRDRARFFCQLQPSQPEIPPVRSDIR
jgi:hypothetical protein